MMAVLRANTVITWRENFLRALRERPVAAAA
jgi:hypothetical protein